jgi:hypothetical protein
VIGGRLRLLRLPEYLDEELPVLLDRLLVKLLVPYHHLPPYRLSHLRLSHLLLHLQLLLLFKLLLLLQPMLPYYIDISHLSFLEYEHGLMLGLLDKLTEQVLLIRGCRLLDAQLYLLVHYLVLYLHLILVKVQIRVRLTLLLLFVQTLHREVVSQFFGYRGK